MQISIVTTSVETKPTAKGSYQQLEVVYKNLTYQGKVESKKIMSFGAGATTFKLLADAQAGSTYEIEVVKNAAGYNDWVSATPSTGAATPSASTAVSKTTTSPKSTYETPEERAQRQILIVRQSSLNISCNALSAGAKAPIPLDKIIAGAKVLESYVFGLTDGGSTGFDDLPDFNPDNEIQ